MQGYRCRLTFASLMLALIGCEYEGASVPKCSDEATLNLVREIVAEQVLDGSPLPETDALRNKLTFNYPRATKLEENIKKYSCEARMVVDTESGKQEIPLVYESQLDDAGDHLVQVLGVDLPSLAAIKQAILATAPSAVIPESNIEAPTPASELPQELLEEAMDVAEPSPAEIEENRMARQVVLDGNGPSGTHPRFRDYPVTEIYGGPAAELDMKGDTAQTFRTRLREALASGEIEASGDYIPVGWGCGTQCFYGTFVSKRTGQVVEDGIGGEFGQRLVGMDANSKLVITEGAEVDDEYNEVGYYAYFYELADARLNLISKVPIPRSLEE